MNETFLLFFPSYVCGTKLVQDENGTITQKEWTEGDEGAFVYGMTAKEKK